MSILLIGGALKSFRFNIMAFIAGFLIGLLYIYTKSQELIEKITYPTPYNAEKVIYKNKNGDCYKYVAESVECPEDKSLIKQHTIGSNTPKTSNDPSSIFANIKSFVS